MVGSSIDSFQSRFEEVVRYILRDICDHTSYMARRPLLNILSMITDEPKALQSNVQGRLQSKNMYVIFCSFAACSRHTQLPTGSKFHYGMRCLGRKFERLTEAFLRSCSSPVLVYGNRGE